MPPQSPRILIVGAGVMGAAVASRLARAGARVEILEALDEPGQGCTADTFGWLNFLTHDPAGPGFALRREALAECRRLDAALGGGFADWTGALSWDSDPAETEARAEAFHAAGCDIRLADAETAAALEPALAAPPALAIWAPGEGVLAAGAVARLLADAQAHGARLRAGRRVEALVLRGGGVAGLRAGDETILADAMILAAGAATAALLRPLDLDRMVETSPAALIRAARPVPALRRLLEGAGPAGDFEARPVPGGLLLAADAPEGEAPEAIAARTRAALAALLGADAPLGDFAARVVRRPVPSPVQGRAVPMAAISPGPAGLHLALAHPGVMFAPLVARLVAAELLEGEAPAELRPLLAAALPQPSAAILAAAPLTAEVQTPAVRAGNG